MGELKPADFTKGLGGYRPVPWEMIPDLGLYMDQVVTFLERQCKGLYAESGRVFTPAMVNNYVKLGLVARPVGKKYGREQLAQLLMICVLKHAASAEGMKKLLETGDSKDLQALYTHFCRMQEEVFHELANENPLPSPMAGAVRCAAYRFICNAVLAKDVRTPDDEKERTPK